MIPGVTKERNDEVIKLVQLETRIHDKVKNYSLGHAPATGCRSGTAA